MRNGFVSECVCCLSIVFCTHKVFPGDGRSGELLVNDVLCQIVERCDSLAHCSWAHKPRLMESMQEPSSDEKLLNTECRWSQRFNMWTCVHQGSLSAVDFLAPYGSDSCLLHLAQSIEPEAFPQWFHSGEQRLKIGNIGICSIRSGSTLGSCVTRRLLIAVPAKVQI